jgi:hypothetical protein
MRYDFSITPCTDHNGTLTGVSDGADYVTLTIYGIHCGSYEVRKDALRHPASHYVGYLLGHSFSEVDQYAVAAVLLAASVLVDQPDLLGAAMDKMLKARDLANSRGSYA